jgi:hypothetical protein
MVEMYAAYPKLYKSIWTRDTLLELKFADVNVAYHYVVHVKSLEPARTSKDGFQFWSKSEALELAKPFVERCFIAQTVSTTCNHYC